MNVVINHVLPSTTVFQNVSKSPGEFLHTARKISSQTQWTLGWDEMES